MIIKNLRNCGCSKARSRRTLPASSTSASPCLWFQSSPDNDPGADSPDASIQQTSGAAPAGSEYQSTQNQKTSSPVARLSSIAPDAHQGLARLSTVRSVVNSQKHDQIIAGPELQRCRRTNQLLPMNKHVRKLRRIRRQLARRFDVTTEHDRRRRKL